MWSRAGTALVNEAGYRIQAVKDRWLSLAHCRPARSGDVLRAQPWRGQWVYCSWGPYEAIPKDSPRLKVRYAMGESVPATRELLGCFRGRDGLEQAKAACNQHQEEAQREQRAAAG